MRLWKYLSVVPLLSGILLYSVHAQKQSSPGQGGTTFAFWYDPWKPDATLKKLPSASVVIGVPPNAVSEIHKSGRRALQYITYYQSRFTTAFLNDRNDLANVGFQVDRQNLKSAFGGQDNYVLCPNSVELKARVLRFLDGSLKQGFDGYFVDNTFQQPATYQVCTAAHQHSNPNAQGGRAYVDLLAAVREKMKQQNPSAMLVTNPGSPFWADQIASGQPSLWDVSDYILWESYGYSSLAGPSHDRWKQTIDQSTTYAANPDKARKILALSYPRNIPEARFSFAVARIFGFEWTANLGDRDQNTGKDGGHFGTFLNDVPFDIGEPVGSPPDTSDPLLHRRFTNGEIFANDGSATQRIPVAPGTIIYVGGAPAEKPISGQLELAPMTAAIVLKKR